LTPCLSPCDNYGNSHLLFSFSISSDGLWNTKHVRAQLIQFMTNLSKAVTFVQQLTSHACEIDISVFADWISTSRSLRFFYCRNQRFTHYSNVHYCRRHENKFNLFSGCYKSSMGRCVMICSCTNFECYLNVHRK